MSKIHLAFRDRVKYQEMQRTWQIKPSTYIQSSSVLVEEDREFFPADSLPNWSIVAPLNARNYIKARNIYLKAHQQAGYDIDRLLDDCKT